MTAPRPVYFILDEAGRPVAHAEGYAPTKSAIRYLLESGEEAGPLRTFSASMQHLETAELDEHGAVTWETTQGLSTSLR